MDFREKVVEAGGDVPQRTPGCNIACSVVAHKMVGSEPSERESARVRDWQLGSTRRDAFTGLPSSSNITEKV